MEKFQLMYDKYKRFGMFIHWGLYAINEYHEQELMRTNISREEYEALIHEFNPVNFSAEEWVLAAKEAGMDYICLTAKHHDGFCLWDTKYTDYNVMNTPYGRDIVREFSDACAKHGLGFAVYYSNPDWYHPNAYNPNSSHQIPPRDTDEPDMLRYVEYLKAQVTELMTQYGPICALFWDILPHVDDPCVPTLNEMVRQMQPGILINDRGFDEGDFYTPERNVPGGAFTRLTEANQSVGQQSWGYRRHEDYYTTRFLEASIDQILTKGGNYLLNIGPMADGSMPPEAKMRLDEIGTWYKRVRESYFTEYATDILSGRREYNVTRVDNDLYLHFPNYPEAEGIYLYPINVAPEKVTLLNTGEEIDFAVEMMPFIYRQPDGRLPFLHLRRLPFDKLSTQVPVVKLHFADVEAVRRCFPEA